MKQKSAVGLAFGGMLAMAAGMGIGRFVYTPILPAMIGALGWSKLDAGLVASANFLGYMIGALVVGQPVFANRPREWLLAALATSVATTGAMALSMDLHILLTLRFVGGIASAFVIISSSTLVLERLASVGRSELAAIHFAGVGVGIAASAIIVSMLAAAGHGWQAQWQVSGATAAVAAFIAITFTKAPDGLGTATRMGETQAARPALAWLAGAHGLFGFGYVITATFLVTIVRDAPAIRSLEPLVWILVGVATIPSVPLWQWLGKRLGLLKAYAVACLVEAVGVVASVEWSSISGIIVSAALLGGTFMGLTALGLMSARDLAGSRPQRAIGLTTASFGLGQMIGPTVAGILSDQSGSLRSASLIAAIALCLAAILTMTASLIEMRNPRK